MVTFLLDEAEVLCILARREVRKPTSATLTVARARQRVLRGQYGLQSVVGGHTDARLHHAGATEDVAAAALALVAHGAHVVDAAHVAPVPRAGQLTHCRRALDVADVAVRGRGRGAGLHALEEGGHVRAAAASASALLQLADGESLPLRISPHGERRLRGVDRVEERLVVPKCARLTRLLGHTGRGTAVHLLRLSWRRRYGRRAAHGVVAAPLGGGCGHLVRPAVECPAAVGHHTALGRIGPVAEREEVVAVDANLEALVVDEREEALIARRVGGHVRVRQLDRVGGGGGEGGAAEVGAG